MARTQSPIESLSELPGDVDLDDGQVRRRVGAEDLGLERLAGVQDDLDRRDLLEDVAVGQDDAVLADDDAGAHALLRVGLGEALEVLLEELEHRVDLLDVHLGLHVEADHRRLELLREDGEARQVDEGLGGGGIGVGPRLGLLLGRGRGGQAEQNQPREARDRGRRQVGRFHAMFLHDVRVPARPMDNPENRALFLFTLIGRPVPPFYCPGTGRGGTWAPSTAKGRAASVVPASSGRAWGGGMITRKN